MRLVIYILQRGLSQHADPELLHTLCSAMQPASACLHPNGVLRFRSRGQQVPTAGMPAGYQRDAWCSNRRDHAYLEHIPTYRISKQQPHTGHRKRTTVDNEHQCKALQKPSACCNALNRPPRKRPGLAQQQCLELMPADCSCLTAQLKAYIFTLQNKKPDITHNHHTAAIGSLLGAQSKQVHLAAEERLQPNTMAPVQRMRLPAARRHQVDQVALLGGAGGTDAVLRQERFELADGRRGQLGARPRLRRRAGPLCAHLRPARSSAASRRWQARSWPQPVPAQVCNPAPLSSACLC